MLPNLIIRFKKYFLLLFIILTLASAYFATQLRFVFSYEQFFPSDDEDLTYFKSFIKEFGSDDNFLLIAIENKPTVFDSSFLDRFHQLTLDIRGIDGVTKCQSLTTLKQPLKTPFGFSLAPLLHFDQPTYYQQDLETTTSDPRFVYNLIDDKATSLVIMLRTKENIDILSSSQLLVKIDKMIASLGLSDKAHIVGRAFFQREIADFQRKEIKMAFILSGLLITIILVLIYRRFAGIAIALGSILVGLIIFLGYLGAIGFELNLLSALFPIIMLIVGSSDVIHIFSKYTDELEKGYDRNTAMSITLNEIGIATFLTSFTTAVGFGSLASSRLETIQLFGIHSAVGVMIAYLVVLFGTTSILLFFDKDQIIKHDQENSIWNRIITHLENVVFNYPIRVWVITGICVLICVFGMTTITTNYSIENNLPRNSRVSSDFKFFETYYAGFRPMEFAITLKDSTKSVYDYHVIREISKLEDYIFASGFAKTSASLAMLHKSVNKVLHGDNKTYYIFPDSIDFLETQALVARLPKSETEIFVSKDEKKSRISCRLHDRGADSVKLRSLLIDKWVNNNLDTSLISVRRTGTAVILDKNAEFIKNNLLLGLSVSILIIGIMMMLLFKSLPMLIISLIPNIIPLVFVSGLLGFLDIPLEAGVAILFTIVFGIAVDDTIHFLSRYKILIGSGVKNEEAIRTTLRETGKAIIVTSIILFFGFFMLIFSANPITNTIGLLISVTLVSALLCDLYFLPVLLLRFGPKNAKSSSENP